MCFGGANVPVDVARAGRANGSPRVWRFVDLGKRLDFLPAGFGWCKCRPAPHAIAAAGKVTFAAWLAKEPGTEIMRLPIVVSVVLGKYLPPELLFG